MSSDRIVPLAAAGQKMAGRRDRRKAKRAAIKPLHDTHKVRHDNGLEYTLCGAEKIEGFCVNTVAQVDCRECLDILRAKKSRAMGSDRIGQLTARMQQHGVNFASAGGGHSTDGLDPLDVAAAFAWIQGDANKAIASYHYSVGNDRHSAVDALYLKLAHESERQQHEQIRLMYRGASDDRLLRQAADNWPTMARKNGAECSMLERIREIARIVIDEKNGRIKTYARIAECLGIDKSNMCRGWAKVVSFARSEMANALAAAEGDILEALR